MALLETKINGTVIKVPDIEQDAEKWFISKEEAYQPDKDAFIEERFKKDHPIIKGANADTIYALCSRSSTLANWLASVNVEYAQSAALPSFYSDLVTPSDYKVTMEVITGINKVEAERAKELQKAAIAYREAIKTINVEKDAEVKKIRDTAGTIATPLEIILMNTTKLPLTLQLAIENYTPKDRKAPSRRAYAREVLINYKRTLLDIWVKDKKFNISKAIDELASKF